MSAQMRHDELERVLRGMRDRLAAVSAEISELLTKVEWHSGRAPPAVRASTRTAAAEITATQEWLNERMSRLPLDPNLRYAAMQELLQVQFTALQKVTAIVSNLLTLRDRPVSPAYLPHQPRPPTQPQPGPMLSPQGLPLGPQPFALGDGLSALGQSAGQAPLQSVGSLFPRAPLPPPDPAWGPLPSLFAQPGPAPGHAPVRLADLTAAPEVDPPSTTGRPKSATSRRKAANAKRDEREASEASPSSTGRLAMVSGVLLAAIVAVAVGGYFAYGTLLGPKTTARSTPSKKERISLGDPSARDSALGQGNGRSFDGASRVPNAPPMSAPPLAEDTPAPPAPADPPPSIPGLAMAEPAPRGAQRGPNQGFVAVIATHRDKQALATIYSDLRKQYPAVLGNRQAEGQSVNLGDKGIWIHLVLMPPGPREQADGLCAQLRTAGYNRCAVRPY